MAVIGFAAGVRQVWHWFVISTGIKKKGIVQVQTKPLRLFGCNRLRSLYTETRLIDFVPFDHLFGSGRMVLTTDLFAFTSTIEEPWSGLVRAMSPQSWEGPTLAL